MYKAYRQVVIDDGQSRWACDCKGSHSDGESCGLIPSSSNNTTNMWSHLRIHHPDVFTSLQRHGVMPSEIQHIADSPSKTSDLPVKLRPKFSIKTKREAGLKATEWLLDSHAPLTCTENKRHRAYAAFISDGAYVSPCFRTIKNHTTMLGTDGRQLSSDFVRALLNDGIKPAGASDPWSENGCGILGSTLHGITRQPPSILTSVPNPVSIWNLETHLGGATPFGKEHHTADVIRKHYDASMQRVGATDPVEHVFANVIDGAANMQAALSDRLAVWCNVHKLQRSVELFRSHSSIASVLSRCRGLVGHFNHSTIGKNQLKVNQVEAGLKPHNLTQDIVIRWSSMHDMLDDLRVNREPIMVYDIRAKNPGAQYGENKLSHEDWSSVQAMIVVLQPARDGTRLLEGDQYVTSSLVVPTICNSIIFVACSLVTDWPHYVSCTAACRSAGRSCRVCHIHDVDTCTKFFWFHCSLLDPRFKSLKNILGLTDSEITGARASFDSLYRMHWSPTLELSCLDSDVPEISEPVRATPICNETAVCGRRALSTWCPSSVQSRAHRVTSHNLNPQSSTNCN